MKVKILRTKFAYEGHRYLQGDIVDLPDNVVKALIEPVHFPADVEILSEKPKDVVSDAPKVGKRPRGRPRKSAKFVSASDVEVLGVTEEPAEVK